MRSDELRPEGRIHTGVSSSACPAQSASSGPPQARWGWYIRAGLGDAGPALQVSSQTALAAPQSHSVPGPFPGGKGEQVAGRGKPTAACRSGTGPQGLGPRGHCCSRCSPRARPGLQLCGGKSSGGRPPTLWSPAGPRSGPPRRRPGQRTTPFCRDSMTLKTTKGP